MIQTQNDVIERLEFLCRYIPSLNQESAIFDSALAEAHGLKRWLNKHYTPTYWHGQLQLCVAGRSS